MARSKDAWLSGPSDLKEDVVEGVPVPGESVKVRGLAAAFSNQAQSEALEWTQEGPGKQRSTINTARMEILQFHHGVVDPKFSLEEAKLISERFGPAFKKVIARIDELSGVDKEAIDEANTRFQAGGASQNGSAVEDAASTRSGGPAVSARAGA